MSPSSRPRLRRDHPVATAFLDETGAIAQDRIFAVGVLKLHEPSVLLRRLQKFRDKRHAYDEIKFANITKDTVSRYKALADTIIQPSDCEFFCFVADRDKADPIERFGSQWDAYAKLAEQLMVAVTKPDELIALMADNYSTPDHVLFEQDLRAGVNRRLGRLAVVSVVRLDSRSSDGLQAVDLLTSAAAFEFRLAAGLATAGSPKAQVAEHVRDLLGADTCMTGWRSDTHSVQIYDHSG